MTKLKLQAKTLLPTNWGATEIRAYASESTDRMPLVVLIFGSLKTEMNVRLHSECLTGDLFSSLKCDCGQQLNYSLDYFKEHGGVLLYMRQEGRDIGLINKLKAYELQAKGADTIEANHQLGFGSDLRNYDHAAIILKDLGVEKVHLMTNNPDKKLALENAGIDVIQRIPVIIPPRPENESYLKTKRDGMGHMI